MELDRQNSESITKVPTTRNGYKKPEEYEYTMSENGKSLECKVEKESFTINLETNNTTKETKLGKYNITNLSLFVVRVMVKKVINYPKRKIKTIMLKIGQSKAKEKKEM